MVNKLNNLNIQQYFWDTTWHCLPPTILKFKLFVLSGFNLKDKKTHICCYALFHDEKYAIYHKVFSILVNVYKFKPKIIIIDFLIL